LRAAIVRSAVAKTGGDQGGSVDPDLAVMRRRFTECVVTCSLN
jgi:hypothetical protein